MKTVEDSILETLSEHLAPSIVKRVVINRETDADGDPVLRIRVVIDKDGASPEPAKLFSATRVVLTVLNAIPDSPFPLLTFPSSDEMPGVAA